MYHFNIILTEFCNANCSHCYMSSLVKGKKKSLNQKNIDMLISRLPNATVSVTITGGEIFLVKNLLEYTIIKIREKFPNILIELESNGIYLYTNNAKNILEHLKNIGVNSIRFSLDPFHEEGGVDLQRVRDLKKYESDKTPVIKFLIQEKALALGKGKSLPSNKIAHMNCMNSEKTIKKTYFFLDINGNVYICTWKCIPALGNIYEEDFSTILKKLNTPFFKNILCGKILEAINIIDKNADNKNIIKEHGQCYLCEKTFREKENAKI